MASDKKRVPGESWVDVPRQSLVKPVVLVAMGQTTRHSGSQHSSWTRPDGRFVYQCLRSQHLRPVFRSLDCSRVPRQTQAGPTGGSAQAWLRCKTSFAFAHASAGEP